jgi:hypothetical protein
MSYDVFSKDDLSSINNMSKEELLEAHKRIDGVEHSGNDLEAIVDSYICLVKDLISAKKEVIDLIKTEHGSFSVPLDADGIPCYPGEEMRDDAGNIFVCLGLGFQNENQPEITELYWRENNGFGKLVISTAAICHHISNEQASKTEEQK